MRFIPHPGTRKTQNTCQIKTVKIVRLISQGKSVTFIRS